MSIGDRLRERRKEIELTLGQVAEYEGVSKTYLSSLERGVNEPNVWHLVARLAKRYDTTTDYLLGLTDDPSPRSEGELPPGVRDLVTLALGLNEARQQELLGHARVLSEAQRAANLSEYDRLLAAVATTGDSGWFVMTIENLLRAVAAGDTARAQLLLASLLRRRNAQDSQEAAE